MKEIEPCKLKNSPYTIRTLEAGDPGKLGDFFSQMSERTKAYFAPHALSREVAQQLCGALQVNSKTSLRVILVNEQEQVVGYFILEETFSEEDQLRYAQYGISLSHKKSLCFAPCLAENLAGKGLGSAVFNELSVQLKGQGIEQLTLMGGVQLRNTIAVSYYRKLGFKTLGHFDTEVENIDMMMEL